jgi:hypothetical protein
MKVNKKERKKKETSRWGVSVCIVHRCRGEGKDILCGQTREQENSLFGNYGNLEN